MKKLIEYLFVVIMAERETLSQGSPRSAQLKGLDPETPLSSMLCQDKIRQKIRSTRVLISSAIFACY